jgi:hypothetical protein
MAKFTKIQLQLPNDFNYKLDVYIAKLKRDSHIGKENGKEKTKAQILVSLAEAGLAHESKNMK